MREASSRVERPSDPLGCDEGGNRQGEAQAPTHPCLEEARRGLQDPVRGHEAGVDADAKHDEYGDAEHARYLTGPFAQKYRAHGGQRQQVQPSHTGKSPLVEQQRRAGEADQQEAPCPHSEGQPSQGRQRCEGHHDD